MAKHEANLVLEQHMRELGLHYTPEYRFSNERRWKFDYLLSDRLKHGLTPAIEIEGAIHAHGRHTRGKGYQNDLDKYNHAAAVGFLVFRFSTEDVLKGKALKFLREHVA